MQSVLAIKCQENFTGLFLRNHTQRPRYCGMAEAGNRSDTDSGPTSMKLSNAFKIDLSACHTMQLVRCIKISKFTSSLYFAIEFFTYQTFFTD